MIAPCPFHASTGRGFEVMSRKRPSRGWWRAWVVCRECGAKGPETTRAGMALAERDAVDAWNHRFSNFVELDGHFLAMAVALEAGISVLEEAHHGV